MNGIGRLRAGPRVTSGIVLALIVGAGTIGCGPAPVETDYGRSRGKSINGTNVLADLIRGRGHAVRAAIRYNDVLADWARVIVRFSPRPGPPDHDEGEWLSNWLAEGPGRKVVYVPRDFDAGPEFWARMIALLPPDAPAAERQKIEAHREQGRLLTDRLPKRSQHPASVDDWFGTGPDDPKKPDETIVARSLGGPWAEGVDPSAASLPRHESLRAENDENVLLTGDGKKLIISWSSRNEEAEEGNVLVVANAAFLLNAGLVNKARRPLAARVVAWVGEGLANVAFVEGSNVLDDSEAGETSPFHLLTVDPFNWIFAHLGVFGFLLCLSLAARIGRPRPEPAGEIERPSAHPVALGAILARTRQVDVARDLIAQYRRWRHTNPAPARTDPTSSSPRRVPRA